MTELLQHHTSCSACGGESLEPGFVEAWRCGSCQHLELFARERA